MSSEFLIPSHTRNVRMGRFSSARNSSLGLAMRFRPYLENTPQQRSFPNVQRRSARKIGAMVRGFVARRRVAARRLDRSRVALVRTRAPPEVLRNVRSYL